MKLTATSTLAILVSVAQSIPLSVTRFGTQELADFDDRKAFPGVTVMNPVSNYKGLNWKALDVIQAGVAGITTGVTPQSGNNVAANGVVETLLAGGISITAQSVKSFDLQYAYFGCVVNTLETVASAPQPCTVAFSGYKKGSSEVFKTVNQQFNPTNAVVSKMSKATFDSAFAGLDRVDVAIVGGLLPNAVTVLLIDNVSYKTYSK
jgi:hypothetical protein